MYCFLAAHAFYPPQLQRELDAFVEEVQFLQKKPKSKYPITLFHGAPGTGKTLFAKKIAQKSGMGILLLSGSNLHQFPKEEAVQKLKEVLAFTDSLPFPVILFIDECDTAVRRSPHGQ